MRHVMLSSPSHSRTREPVTQDGGSRTMAQPRDEPLSAFGADSRTIGSRRPDASDHDNTVI
jgi:hypothetical protein